MEIETATSRPSGQAEAFAPASSELPEAVRLLPPERIIHDEEWRRFAAAVLAADWTSYPDKADRVEKARLDAALAQFPQGFRLWGLLPREGSPSDQLSPRGYTAWHPISRETFESLAQRPEELARGKLALPVAPLKPGGENYLYLFNYSVAPWLIGSGFAKPMLQAYAADLAATQPAGMVAITVSDHGARVAKRLGLYLAGRVTMKGKVNTVYAWRDGS